MDTVTPPVVDAKVWEELMYTASELGIFGFTSLEDGRRMFQLMIVASGITQHGGVVPEKYRM